MLRGDPEFSEERWAAVNADSRIYHFTASLCPTIYGGAGSYVWALTPHGNRTLAQLARIEADLRRMVVHALARIEASEEHGFMAFDAVAAPDWLDGVDPWQDGAMMADLRWSLAVAVASINYIEDRCK